MHYRLTAADISAPTCLGQTAWQRSQLPESLGTCFTDSLRLDDELTLVYFDYQSPYDLSSVSMLERSPALTVAIALEGRTSTIGADGTRFDFVPGHSTVSAYARVSGERRFPGNQPIRQLRLIAGESILHKYGLDGMLDGVRNDQPLHHVPSSKHGCVTQRLADSLVHLHDCTGSLLDIQVAALSLLAEQTRPFMPREAPCSGISSKDQDRILRARDILMEHFDRSLTLGYLCTAVGTNEFKLKKDFREMFGTSPHRMLTEIRMEKAWELLETGLHVSTVAYRVGYQHLSSFSAAFERYYGRTPKSVASRQKNH